MKRIGRYLRLLWVVPLVASATIFAQTPPTSPIVFVQLQTGSTTSASQEFIELANVSDAAVDVSNWRVEYFSAGSVDFSHPTRTVLLHGELPAAAHYLLASTGYLSDIANDTFTATLAKAGGHVRLVQSSGGDNPTDTVQDLLGWGTALHPAGAAAAAPDDGQSLLRKTDPDSGTYVNTANNSNDFGVGAPNPTGYIPLAPIDTPTDPNPPPATDPSPDITVPEQPAVTEPQSLASPQITELLPNPAPPATDSQDEYVELYNPNTSSLNLNGYKLQTGSNFTYSFSFGDEDIAAGAYRAFYVTQTKLTLANTASRARLLSPTGSVVSDTTAYENAGDGEAWMWDGATWQWTTTPTPSAANVLTQSAAITKTATPKTTTTKKAATAKPKPQPAKKTSKAGVAGGSSGTVEGATDEAAVPPLHPAILAGVGGLAILYAGYEYRHDLANALHKLKRHRRLGAKNRAGA